MTFEDDAVGTDRNLNQRERYDNFLTMQDDIESAWTIKVYVILYY